MAGPAQALFSGCKQSTCKEKEVLCLTKTRNKKPLLPKIITLILFALLVYLITLMVIGLLQRPDPLPPSTPTSYEGSAATLPPYFIRPTYASTAVSSVSQNGNGRKSRGHENKKQNPSFIHDGTFGCCFCALQNERNPGRTGNHVCPCRQHEPGVCTH